MATNLKCQLMHQLLGLFVLTFLLVLKVKALPLDCADGHTLKLNEPVMFDKKQLTAFKEKPLRVVLIDNTAPMAMYDKNKNLFRGVSYDVLCFIGRELGLVFQLVNDEGLSLKEKVSLLESGQADIITPLSLNHQRKIKGIFTKPYFQNHYVAVASKNKGLSVQQLDDLENLKVGYFEGSSVEEKLLKDLPQSHLVAFPATDNFNHIYQALLNGQIDVALVVKAIFKEKRFSEEYLDLEIIYTLDNYPRDYGFLFANTPLLVPLAQVFNRYLAVLDVTESINANATGEREFFKRYLQRERERNLYQLSTVIAVFLAIVALAVFWYYRKVNLRLRRYNARIREQQIELRAINKQLEALSQTDSLTGLFNRRRFDSRLQKLLSQEDPKQLPLSLIIIDIDHFKSINDGFGHEVGDKYLFEIAQVLKKVCQSKKNLVARWGGEEFFCLLPKENLSSAKKLAQEIAQSVTALKLPYVKGKNNYLTVSIGIATLLQYHYSASEFIFAADKQLYAAKNAGRNQIYAAQLS